MTTTKDQPILLCKTDAELFRSALERMKLWATPEQIKYIRRKKILEKLTKDIANG